MIYETIAKLTVLYSGHLFEKIIIDIIPIGVYY